MRNRPRNTIRIDLTFDNTSSLNKFFLCECGRKFEKKLTLTKHVSSCDGVPVTHVCHWCHLSFKNRGNLVQHAKFIHGDDSYRDQEQKLKKFQCNACDARYDAMWKLKYHIRGTHYNLLAVTPRFETNSVNQIWFEKVLNSTHLVEIHKTGPNTLTMKPTAPNNSIQLSEHNEPSDLHSVYPTGHKRISQPQVTCKICKKGYKSRDLKKHIQEAHQKDFAKHKCNNCNMTFKRSYIYLKHVCNKSDGRRKSSKVAGVTQFGKSGIQISNVSSLLSVEID